MPTLSDHCLGVEERFVDAAESGEIDQELVCEMAADLAGDAHDLYKKLAFSRGAHAAAKIYRAAGNDVADLLHAMAQDLLLDCVELLSRSTLYELCTVETVHPGTAVRH